ncbi:MAG: hypothetical protein MJ124_03965 [Lachnospiraceae bacterium]|nr:hypothetical protein [Lachnospiraceae bacterium]
MADTKEQLNDILEKYNIGKKPLARLLGWGDTTVMNQLKGAGANGEFAEKIAAIHDNEYLFLEILEQNKGKLTPVAYRKAKAAVEKLILKSKSSLIVQYLVKNANDDIAPYQVVAALFYAQAASLMLKGLPLFDDDVCYYKRNFIPYPEIYSTLLKNKVQKVRTSTDFLAAEDKELIVSVNKVLNGYSPNAVKAMLKADKAGLIRKKKVAKTEGEAENPDSDYIFVSLSEMQGYFIKELQETGFADASDYKNYWEQKIKKR